MYVETVYVAYLRSVLDEDGVHHVREGSAFGFFEDIHGMERCDGVDMAPLYLPPKETTISYRWLSNRCRAEGPKKCYPFCTGPDTV